MSDTQPPAGADLARQALAAYKASSKPATAVRKKRPVRTAVRHGDGRDPAPLAAVMDRMSTDAGWQTSVGGGTLREQWPTLCPQYATTVEPVHYDPERRCLELRPATPAYATQLRLLGVQVVKQINDKVGRTVVERLRVLPVGNLTSVSPTSGRPTGPDRAEAPVKTRQDGCAHYQEALAAVLAHKPGQRQPDPTVTAAIERQNFALRTHRPDASPDAAALSAETARFTAKARAAEAVHNAALRRAREEKAGRQQLDVPPLFRSA